MNTKLPTVSIITPTYQRHHFMEQLLRCVRLQDYPKHLMELLILDDSPEPLVLDDAWKEGLEGMDIRVIRNQSKLSLGEKRNRLNRYADGKIIVAFDDDDYYPSTRVSHAVESLQQTGLPLAGSTMLLIWFVATNSLVAFGPYAQYHSCNGALAYTKAYVRKHRYDAKKNAGEEPAFTKDFSEPMVQLHPAKTMLAISHHENTVVKTEDGEARHRLPDLERFPWLPQTSWLDFVPDEESRAFYRRKFMLAD